jgi:subtilisin family serine protease
MDIIKALDWAGASKADIVNMSFTGPVDPEQRIMLTALGQKGIVLIAAAGNEGPKAPAAYPAAFPEVIAVTATDSDDNLYAQANRGAHIAVAAPGVAILVASPGGSYQMRSGTSFAAPQVSGVAALLLQRNHKLDPVAIRTILTSTARDLGPPGRDDQFGAGLVDAMSAVASAGEQSTDVSARSAQPAN